MKRSKYSNSQIMTILKNTSTMARLKVMEDENRRLNKMYTEERLKPKTSPRSAKKW